MNKLWLPVLVVTCVGTLAAQAGQQKTAAVKPITVIGCVAQSEGAYRLDHAMVGTDIDSETQQRPSTEASPTPKMLSYMLTGADVKSHLGHKVEVTGTMSSDKTSKDAAGIKNAPGMKLAGTLNVKSVKMVAATCP